jgi:hypothetical protein
MSTFKSLGNLDFSLACKQGHRAHFAQVKAYRITGLIQHAGGGAGIQFFLIVQSKAGLSAAL